MNIAYKKILVTGANGQLGNALQNCAPVDFVSIAADKSVLDISNRSNVFDFVKAENPDGIINAAAYTAVDLAEKEPELAYRVNAEGPLNLAFAARELSIPLVHISTDFVFDGTQSTPYKVTDAVNPLSVYGGSKAEGEKNILTAYSDNVAVIRTSWVYSLGYPNFVTTMLRLLAEKDHLAVVSDQIGTPTSALPLATVCWEALEKKLSGIFHWSDAGVASWYDFAVAIQEEALDCGILQKAIPVLPINTTDYPTPAIRPPYSVLDKAGSCAAFGQSPQHWRIALRNGLRDKA